MTLQQLDSLLNEIQIDENYDQLVSCMNKCLTDSTTDSTVKQTGYIKSLKGSDSMSTMKRAFVAILDRSVQKQFSWSGLRTKKPAFMVKYKLIVELMYDGIHRSKLFRIYKNRRRKKIVEIIPERLNISCFGCCVQFFFF